MTIRVAIAGYGNLGRGVEAAVTNAPDMELVGIFTRRDPKLVNTATSAPSYALDDIASFANKIDVVVICGGSATDLPVQTPELAKSFTVVDSFDTHANIPAHFANVDAAAREAKTIGVISCGWDPGLFSLARLYASAALPEGADYTFWGRGVSQGHSDAIRRIPGVADARQYTVPVEAAVQAARSGSNPELTTRQKHTRECFVVAEEGADLAAIEKAIVTMPNYFADYDTTVTFISQEELNANHAGLPHGGTVIRSGRTGFNNEFADTIEFSLALDSNPFFTGSVLASVARAAYRMHEDGQVGARTMFDIPPALLSPLSAEELRAHLM
ncbi:MAG: diaminopimelate dehydrogenase [Coriobacteriales bacterium]|nr:diaminopimelate dehydrogenase [Coriobacteriales bacterium]